MCTKSSKLGAIYSPFTGDKLNKIIRQKYIMALGKFSLGKDISVLPIMVSHLITWSHQRQLNYFEANVS